MTICPLPLFAFSTCSLIFNFFFFNFIPYVTYRCQFGSSHFSVALLIKNANVVQIVLMWCKCRFDVDYITCHVSLFHYLCDGKVTKDRIKDNL